MTISFVDSDFSVPLELATAEYRLRALTIHDVVKDYEAVVMSANRLTKAFPGWGGWPNGLTIEQNLIDLGWHQKEFQRRRSFAYIVVSLDDTKSLGCVYVHPSSRRAFDAEVYLWAREASVGDDRDAQLADTVRQWLEDAWPFKRVAFPGRSIEWEVWRELPRS